MNHEIPMRDEAKGSTASGRGRAVRFIHGLVPWCARLVILYNIWVVSEELGFFVVIVFAGPFISLGLIEAGFLVTEAERPPARRGSRAVGRMVATTMPLAAVPLDVGWLIILALSVGLRVVTKGLPSVVLPAILALIAAAICVQTRGGTLINLVWGATAAVLMLHAVAEKLIARSVAA